MLFIGVIPLTHAGAAESRPAQFVLPHSDDPIAGVAVNPILIEWQASQRQPWLPLSLSEPRIPFSAVQQPSMYGSIMPEAFTDALPYPAMTSTYQTRADSTPVRDVPLPAAIWLFGSALAGFVSFSARRSI
ncbi:MAG: hypothetical protein ABW076_09290 [Candidatus Thiodiazotropha sp.]